MNNPRLPTEDWIRHGPPTILNCAMINCFLPYDVKMKILVWNCKGVIGQSFKTNARDLIS